MSVGDIKGFRRRLARQEALGHTPRRSHLSVAASIAKNRITAMRMAKAQRKKKS